MDEIRDVAREHGIELAEGEEIKPGDLYLAGRNADIKCLRCRYVNHASRWIGPEGNEYPYDIHECIKIREYGKESTED